MYRVARRDTVRSRLYGKAGAVDGRFSLPIYARAFSRLVKTLPGNNRAFSVVEASRRCKFDLPPDCFVNPIPARILRASTRRIQNASFSLSPVTTTSSPPPKQVVSKG